MATATYKRLIVVAHQIPWTLNTDNNTFKLRKGHEAQFSGSPFLESHYEILHIGWCSEVNTINFEKESELFLKEKNCYLVSISDQDASSHYEGYCKNELWPLFHYILWDNATDGQVEAENWEKYQKVNRIFADKVQSIYQPGDLIWIQDYHLLLVPQLLRMGLPDALIGYFHHAPFPSSEIFRCLPKRKAILQGVLGSDMIGFQTYSHARHFISSATRIVGCESSQLDLDYQGRRCSIAITPMGINLERLETYLSSESVKEKIKHIGQIFATKKIIVGRDTMDHVKGIQHKLDAFEKFMEIFPEWHDKVALVQISTTNQATPNLFLKVSESVARINGRYGSLASIPVHHYHHKLDPEEYYALMSIADMALITPLRDGLNTTSHEFVVCQKDNHGVLILSEFAGTAGAMSGASLVNPWDILGVAHAIHDALVKSNEDRIAKHKQLFEYVTTHTSDLWAERFIRELIRTTSNETVSTPYLDFDRVEKVFRRGKKRLILLDYDGTLTAIRLVPDAAVPPPEMLVALEKLVNDPQNVVFIISGRDQDCLDGWVGQIDGLGLSAEHGSFIKYPGGKWINLAAKIDLGWKEKVTEIFDYYTERTQGSFVEHKKYSITWHYRLADPGYGVFQANQCHLQLNNTIVSKLPVDVIVGKKNLEVRPSAMNKGGIVKQLLEQRQENCDFVFCAGDDQTDEDMFGALSKSGVDSKKLFSCTIGPATKKTRAKYHVTSPKELIGLLQRLAAD